MARRGIDRGAVLALAGDLADAQGVEAVTVARVAAGLGIRAPSLYNHVPGREALVQGVAAGAIGELTARLAAAAVGRGGEDALLAAAHAYRAYARAHPGRYAAMQRAPASGDPEVLAAGERAVDVLSRILGAWQLKGDDAVHAVRALRSALHGFSDLERVGSFQLAVDPDESFERLVRGFAAGLTSSLATR